MFKKDSPANFRRDVGDVILLITAGEPRGKNKTKQLTMQYANHLKDKNVLIVAAGIGRQSENVKLQNVLINLATSRDFFVKAQFDELDDIVNKLVEMTCIKPGRLYISVGFYRE